MPHSNPITISIRPGGVVESIYDDNAIALYDALGKHTVRRASHVEPCGDGWSADMSPIGGPVLGPFLTRQEALNAEVKWLNDRGY